jgi:Holliday junction resolvase RusA-like endonuclease
VRLVTASFELWVPGRPKAKERPRLSRGRAYTPAKTIEEEQRISALWRAADGPYFDGPVGLLVDYYPEGQWIRIEERDWASSLNADVDNLVKLTGDALQGNTKKGIQGAAFGDDRYVLEVHAAKFPRGMVDGDGTRL